MPKRKLRRKKMWNDFINATMEIIEDEGFDKVTIRKIGQKAGYNSATLYNYFDDLSQLLFFASLKLLTPYAEKINQFVKEEQDPVAKYIKAWELFCEYSFEQPVLFHAVFIMDVKAHPDTLLQNYYEIYSEEIDEVSSEAKFILYHNDLSVRGFSILKDFIDRGLLTLEEARIINDMTNLIWKGVLSDVLSNRTQLEKEEAKQMVMETIRLVIQKFITEK